MTQEQQEKLIENLLSNYDKLRSNLSSRQSQALYDIIGEFKYNNKQEIKDRILNLIK